MYNTEFQRQLDESRRNLFGNNDPRTASVDSYLLYSPPKDLKLLPCIENEHGEFVPVRSDLERRATE